MRFNNSPSTREMKTKKKHMKAITKLIHSAFAVVSLAIGTVTANADPGDIFVGTSANGIGTIYKYTPDGTPSTFAGGLTGPTGLAFDTEGDLFVADYGIGMIYKFAPDGTRTTFTTQVSQPTALAFDGQGNLFEGDYGSGAIYKFDLAGNRATFAAGSLHPLGSGF
jgi:hypothetical protein